MYIILFGSYNNQDTGRIDRYYFLILEMRHVLPKVIQIVNENGIRLHKYCGF